MPVRALQKTGRVLPQSDLDAMRSRDRASLLACLALLLCGGPADAAGGEVTRASLSWVRLPGAEGCIAAPALAEAVERRLGHPVFSPAPSATLSVEGWVEPSPPT